MKHFNHYIDIVGVCNLRCPSCPVGNSVGAARPTGTMSAELFTQIVEKIRRETPEHRDIHLYNWTEPALHPELPEFIRIARAHGLETGLSTNLNLFRKMEEVIAARPKSIRISLSGYSQEKYGRTHERGKIENVIRGMHELRAIIDRLGAKTELDVYYHCYADNLGEDYENMAALCEKLDISFSPIWANLMPIEKNIEYFDEGLTGSDAELVALLPIDPKTAKKVALADPSSDCVLRSGLTAINCDGSVSLCCAVYDSKYTIAGSFLDTSHDELQAAKYAHPFCAECMSHGLHDVLTYGFGPQDATKHQEAVLEEIHPIPLPPHFAPDHPSKDGRRKKRKPRWKRAFAKLRNPLPPQSS